ncbi:hypothetical protein [Actinokineospora xionganensis]|uniref:Uncharacterized protein n=1 Tax=Actinokineospora xionganensis TaxID=2684470 RepID=A0ABR7L2L3_9PSEU|nr:hypothetical protein [Actinokineospora xionganensis]MBC6446920.1 hypothetical protein [Actinokineospora xionganensis]
MSNTDHDTRTENEVKAGKHAAPEGAERHPLIDLSRDPNPGRADHAAPDDEA